MVNVILASTALQKIEAVKKAMEKLSIKDVDITGYKAPSGIREQPVDNETVLGCENRLKYCLNEFNDGNIDIFISIENGIELRDDDMWHDFAIVIVCLPGLAIKKQVKSESVIFPTEYVREAREQGFKTTTVGSIFTKYNPDVDSQDPHSFLTKGKLSRPQILTDAIIDAFNKIGIDTYSRIESN